jgi:hypothetical protein
MLYLRTYTRSYTDLNVINVSCPWKSPRAHTCLVHIKSGIIVVWVINAAENVRISNSSTLSKIYGNLLRVEVTAISFGKMTGRNVMTSRGKWRALVMSHMGCMSLWVAWVCLQCWRRQNAPVKQVKEFETSANITEYILSQNNINNLWTKKDDFYFVYFLCINK